MKTIKRLSAILLFAVLFVVSAVLPVSADAANSSVKNSQDGVYYIQMTYTQDDESFPVQGGTGFFFSNDMLMTCEHVVNLDDDTLKALEAVAKSKYGSFSKNNLTAEVMLQSDISVTADVILTSEDADWAVLKLNEDIEVTPLVFGNSNECENTQNVYAIGYPSVVSNYDTVKEFSRSDVTTTGGTITKVMSSAGVDLIQHSALMSAGNSGGPLVNANGEVIGINRGRIKDDNSESYFYATATEQVLRILDQKKITYTQNTEAEDTENSDHNNFDTKILILVIAIVVFLVCAIVVLAVLLRRKQLAPNMPASTNDAVDLPRPSSVTFFTLTRKKNNERCAIDKQEFIVGKGSSSDYQITGNEAISRNHVKLSIRGKDCFVTDLGSSNGTFLNGKRLSADSEYILSEGDTLRIADEEFVFHV